MMKFDELVFELFDDSMVLPSSQYIGEVHNKNLIVLHHTVGGSPESTIEWWKRTTDRVATSFLIGKDGKIFRTFDEKFWAYHIGLGNSSIEKRSIGIEMASEGPLLEHDGKYYCFDRISPRTIYDDTVWSGRWRGHSHFAEYPIAQYMSCCMLVRYLLSKFPDIKRQYPASSSVITDTSFSGVVGHHHLRKDKSDLHPGFPWNILSSVCNLSGE